MFRGSLDDALTQQLRWQGRTSCLQTNVKGHLD
jgi:hypothetical protein